MSNLATGYKSAGKLDLALPLYEETVGLMKARWGTDHPDTLAVMSNLAAAYHAAGKLDRALPLFEETLRLKKARLGADHPDTLATMNNLGSVHRDAGKPELALPLLREAAAGMESRRFQHSHAGTIVTNLVNCHEQLRQFAEAEVWRRKWLAVVKGRAGADSVAYAGELAALGLNLLQQQKAADAEPLLREALALREQKQPDAWTTFNTKSVLGGALLIQKKYADAEPLLLAGFRGMKQRADMIPREAKERLREALARLVRLYEATGKQDEAGKWRKELESISGPGS
jgi:tetratricopeptide (TPR) repeat protein